MPWKHTVGLMANIVASTYSVACYKYPTGTGSRHVCCRQGSMREDFCSSINYKAL